MSEVVLELTQQELDDISKCEAVIVRDYQRADGSMFARAVAYGDADEMHEQASIRGLCIVPVGLSVVCQQVVMVSDLLGAEQREID